MERVIPGWKEVSLADVQKAVENGELPYQLVDDHWYEMEIGHKALQELVDEWLDGLMYIWLTTSYTRDGKRHGNHTQNAEIAEPILKAWGRIDENGIPVGV